ncbi:hydroxymethylglutaryl-CoA synthase family protein [Streptomyces sp. NPDC088757]|uniref:hydroxymethylglutaryl-CoA synthase family protein n=1 Tax=Streptomyces sp. NPDC088757 TaxID=3365889 RepID=UPI00381733E3
MTGTTAAGPARIGIEAMNVYAGVAKISARALFDARGLDPDRFGNLMTDERSVQLPWEDSVTNAVNAAKPLVDALSEEDRRSVELLVTSSESGLDHSKSLASWVHGHLGLSRQCRYMEVKQACYGATGALQLAAGYLRSGLRPGAKALIIATDVNPMDAYAKYAEPTTGHGAVALLVSDAPGVLALTPGAYGLNSFDVMDTARPAPDYDLYNPDLSLLAYLECLSDSFRAYLDNVPGADFAESFDHVVMHTPFGGMVRAAHRKLMREQAPRAPQLIAQDFERRVVPSLRYARSVGNLCSGSIWLALASLIDHESAERLEGSRLGMFSYGSGCASEFFGATVLPGAKEIVGKTALAERLGLRRDLSFAEYEEMLPVTRRVLVPRSHREIDLSAADTCLAPFRDHGKLLVLAGVEDYIRRYEWR